MPPRRKYVLYFGPGSCFLARDPEVWWTDNPDEAIAHGSIKAAQDKTAWLHRQGWYLNDSIQILDLDQARLVATVEGL